VHSTAELTSVLEQNKSANKFILGGGSNMLLTKDIDALVIHIDLKGKITAEMKMKIMFG
jgi:UDP-N-acetylmuramate dehydrogenase